MHRKLEGDVGHAHQLVEQDGDEMRVGRLCSIERADAADVQDQLTHQRGDIDDAARARERLRESRREVQRAAPRGSTGSRPAGPVNPPA
jgi:hypothetical protein